jgi:hypothetical protein
MIITFSLFINSRVNRLAEEEMAGVVKGYSHRLDAPWSPPEEGVIFPHPVDQTSAGSKVNLFDEADLNQGYHLNADSTDYIYKARDSAYTNVNANHGVESKPATLRNLAPDYNDFDYVDVRGSSADVDSKRTLSTYESKPNNQ